MLSARPVRDSKNGFFSRASVCVLLSVAIAALIPNSVSGKSAGTIEWCENMTSATKQAVKEKKLIFLLFSAPGRCGACQKLEREVLAVTRVADWLNSGYVCFRCNPDAGYGQKLRAVYPQGRGVPTMIIVNPKGKAIGDMSGFNSVPDKFMNQVANISRGLRPGFGTP
jgi:thioredoxin-related protein